MKLEHFLQLERSVRALQGQWRRLAALLGKATRLLGRLARNPLPLVFPNFHAWPKFWRHFAQNLLVGVFIEAVVHLSGHTWHLGVVTGLENAALDAVMRLNADTEKGDGRPVQAFIEVDEQTWRSPAWGDGEPKTVPLVQVADLIAQAAARQPRYVLVDFLIEGPKNGEQEAFLKRMEGVLAQYPDSRLLFVRGFRRPLERYAVQGVRPAYAVDALMAKHPQRVFAVAPNFVPSGGQVLRHWRLWESACYPLGEQGEGVWTVVPSPQLMIEMLEKRRRGEGDWDIQWRLPFDPARTKSVDPKEKEVRRCITASKPQHIAGESLEAFSMRSNAWEDRTKKQYSARLADYQAGVWVQKHYDTCYQQAFFTDADCERGSAPAPVLMQDEKESAAGRQLANRVLFRLPDLKGKNETALRRGEKPVIRNYEHFKRVAAAELLAGEPPAVDLLAKISDSAKQGKLTVAVIGASYDESHDLHMTPLGKMPGSLVLVNAVDSLQTAKILQALHGWRSWLIMFATLISVSAAFALLSAFWATVLMCVLVVLILVPLSLVLIRHSIWLNIAAPIIGIYLHRELEIFMEHRKHRILSPTQENQ